MPFYEQFFYKEPSSRDTYTRRPQGAPHINRLMAGKPAYLQPRSVLLNKRRTLIVNVSRDDIHNLPRDKFSHPHRDTEMAFLLNECLLYMKKCRFEVKLFRENQLVDFKNASVLDTLFNKDNSIAIHEAMIQAKLPAEQVFIIDQSNLIDFLTDDFVVLGSFKSMLIGTSANQCLSLQKFISNQALSTILKKYCNVLPSLEIMNCINLSMISLPKQPFSKLQILSIGHEGTLDKKYLDGYEVNQALKLSQESIKALIDNSPNLKVLKLKKLSQIDESLFNDSCWKALADIHIEHVDMSGDFLNKLLKAAPNLRKIALKGINGLKLDSIRTFDNSSLKYLEIMDSNLPTEIIVELIKSSTPDVLHIHTLTLYDAIIQAMVESKPKAIKLAATNISNTQLEYVLHNTPRLEAIALSHCHELQGELNLTGTNPFIEQIELDCYRLSGDAIKNMIQFAPNLQRLTIIRLNNFNPELFQDVDIKHLELISIDKKTGGNITDEGFKTLVEKASNLKAIIFLGCRPTLIIAWLQQNHPRITYNCRPLTVDSHKTDKAKQLRPKRKFLDADTRFNDNKTFNINRLFLNTHGQNPPPSTYRLYPYDAVEINPAHCPASQAFILKETNFELKPVTSINRHQSGLYPVYAQISSKGTYFCRTNVRCLTQDQPLPSLSAEDKITDMYIKTNVDYDIKYNLNNNFYYIQFKEPHPISIDLEFIVTAKRYHYKLPPKVQDLVNQLKAYDAKALELKGESLTGHDYYKAMVTQKVGACRHRAIAFKLMMNQEHPKKRVRIIKNDVHMFIEMMHRNKWQTIDLGGYPAFVNIKEMRDKPAAPALSRRPPVNPSVKTNHLKAIRPPSVTRRVTAGQLIHGVLNSKAANTLIDTATPDILKLILFIQSYCQDNNKPYYCIDSADDIVCQSPYVKANGEQGVIKPGPGGGLYEFLTQTASGGVLIVNYTRFSRSEIVGHNSLIDELRFADGTPIPPTMKIIGLIDRHSLEAYQGSDFYGRFDEVITRPLITSGLNLALNPVNQIEMPDNALADSSVNLYGSEQWEDRLIGCWRLNNDALYFEEGALVTALRQNKQHLLIINPPQNQSFRYFLDTCQLRKSVFFQGSPLIAIPDDFRFSICNKTLGIFTGSHLSINTNREYHPDMVILNTETLDNFYQQLVVNEKKQLCREAGILANAQGGRLSVLVTAAVSPMRLIRFIDACQAHHITLNLTLAPGIKLLEGVDNPFAPLKAFNPAQIEHTQVIVSNDMDVTLSFLPQDSHIIDVSELAPNDLLGYNDGHFNQQSLRFSFHRVESYLQDKLSEGKTVVLKGLFSQNISEALHRILFERLFNQTNSLPGRLIIITDKQANFPFSPQVSHHVNSELKLNLLQRSFDDKAVKASLSQQEINQHPLTILLAKVRFKQQFPECPSSEHWQGIAALPKVKLLEPFDITNASQMAQDFIDNRFKQIEKAFSIAPFIFLAGPTGAGKTTFVHQHLSKRPTGFYQGENEIKQWASDSRQGIKLLFIDEANIGFRHWSLFEGLFLEKPAIYIDREYIGINPEHHKVIFAGNPSNYQGGRNIPSLFERHGNTVVFEPLNLAVLFFHVLKPVFEGLSLDLSRVARPIFDVVQFLSRLSDTDVLITPREVRMMALLIRCSYEDASLSAEGFDIEQVASYYSWMIGKTLVPLQDKQAFERRIKGQKLKTSLPELDGFCKTAANKPALMALDAHLKLRAKRRAGGQVFESSGLGGLIIEGEPGIGKSVMAKKMLAHYGLKESRQAFEQGADCFYHLSPTLGVKEKTKRLLNAFNQGWVVVIDEMNSSLMLERLLNDLLMGKGPDGKAANKPGFMLIGTQNPAEQYQGRMQLSAALMHRLHYVKLPSPTKADMVDVLDSLGLPHNIVNEMVEEYILLRQTPVQEGQHKLSFRDLIKAAKQYLETNPKTSLKRRQDDIERYSPRFFSTNPAPEKRSKATEALNVVIPDAMDFG